MQEILEVSPTDFSRFDPVPHQTTLHLINNFVLQTTRFLNRFSNVCEEKLANVSRDIQGLEISLSIIEAKLNIDGLDEKVPGATAAAPPAVAPAVAPRVPPADLAAGAGAGPEPEPEMAAPVASTMVKEDPNYKRFCKMLDLGVPLQAVKNKMAVEMPDLDPSMLDDPLQPAPSS